MPGPISKDSSYKEIDIVARMLQDLREELVIHAHRGAIQAGFQDRQTRFMAVTSVLLGAAQLYAVSINGGVGLYEIFKAQCAVMATSEAAKSIRASVMQGIGDDIGNRPPLIVPEQFKSKPKK